VDARFRAVRHPDSVDAAGPYFVEVEQITGKPAVTGELRYEVRTQGTQARKGTASLRRLSPNRWQGQIPGQPPDSEICYHFAFTWGGEVRALHPRRAPLTQYRFRVVFVRARRLQTPPRLEPSETDHAIRMIISSGSEPRGTIRFRVAPGSDFDRETALTIQRLHEKHSYSVAASLPTTERGAIVDYYFEFRSPSGTLTHFPADAPARFLSCKVPLLRLHGLVTGGSQVTSLAVHDGRLLVGLAGGGLLDGCPDDDPLRWTSADGLASGWVTRLATDQAEGIIYAGTRLGGLQALLPGGGFPVPVTSRLLSAARSPQFDDLHRLSTVDLLLVSPLDGSVLFQHARTTTRDVTQPSEQARTFILQDGKVLPFSLTDSNAQAHASQFMGITAAAFDVDEGCLLVAAQFQSQPSGMPSVSETPVLQRVCGNEVVARQWVHEVPVAGGLAGTYGIEALAFEPSTGLPLVAARHAAPPGSAPVETTVYRWQPPGLTPVDPQLSRLTSPVRGMESDPRTEEVWLATDDGLIVFQRDTVRRIGASNGLPGNEVTALVHETDGRWLVGTNKGVARVHDQSVEPVWSAAFDTGAHQPDMRLVDWEESTGQWLVRFGGSGVAVMQIDGSGKTQILRSFEAGCGLPDGPFGRAIFGEDPGVLYLVRIGSARVKPGIIRIAPDGTWTLLTEDDGLRGNPIQLMEPDPAGRGLWLGIASTPFTKDAGLQLYDPVLRREVHYTRLRTSFAEFPAVVPTPGEVFFSTGFGVFRAHNDEEVTRVSDQSITWPLALGDDGTLLATGAVSHMLARWNWETRRFQLIRYALSPNRRVAQGISPPDGIGGAGLVFDTRRRVWHRLDGGLYTIDSTGGAPCSDALPDITCLPKRVLVRDSEDGLPLTSSRLFFDPDTDRLLVASEEGLAILELLDGR